MRRTHILKLTSSSFMGIPLLVMLNNLFSLTFAVMGVVNNIYNFLRIFECALLWYELVKGIGTFRINSLVVIKGV